MAPLLEVLRSGRVLLMDGAMGTQLQRLGLRPGENGALWNLGYPKKVRAVHQAYLAAGAEVVLTNTFLANALPPAESRAVWRHALNVIGPGSAFRIAAVGPVAGEDSTREFDDLRRVCVGEWEPNERPDAILLETCSTPRVLYPLIPLRDGPFPVLLSLTFRRDPKGRLLSASGHAPEWFARQVWRYQVAALGVNCGNEIGMDEIIEIVHRYRHETDLPLFARPNAGTPIRRGARWVYPRTPTEMAERLPELVEAGVSMVGGCCGTTPAHISAFRKVLDRSPRMPKKH
jgi:methionine synthase I (cobalamin-dependent)